MPITLTNPVTLEGQTCSTVWIMNLNIISVDPSRPINVSVMLVPIKPDGTLFYKYRKMMKLQDVFTLAATDPQLASGIQGIFDAIQEQVNNQVFFTSSG